MSQQDNPQPIFAPTAAAGPQAADEARQGRLLALSRDAHRALRGARAEAALLTQFCQALLVAGHYRAVWVALPVAQTPEMVLPVAQAGLLNEHFGTLCHAWNRHPARFEPFAKVLRQRHPLVWDSLAKAPSDWRAEGRAIGYQSAALLPITYQGQAMGVLVILALLPKSLASDEIQLLVELSEDLAGALRAVREREQARLTLSSLATTESRLSSIMQVAPIGILLSRETRIINCNPAFRRLMRLPPEQNLAGATALQFFGDRDRQRLQERNQRREAGATELTSYDCQGRRADGSEFPLHLDVQAVTLPDGPATLAFFSDISERVRIEEALRLRSLLMDQIHDAVISTDLQGRITSFNAGAERLYGYSAAEVIGKEVKLIYPPEALAARDELLARLRREGQADAELLFRRKSGELFNGHISLTLTRDSTGEPSGIFGFTQDVTARVMAEEALHQSEARRAMALRAANLGVWNANMVAGQMVCNRRWAAILGYDTDELVLDADAWRALFHPEDLPTAVRLWEEHNVGRAELYQAEHRLRTREGQWRWVQSIGQIMQRDAQGGVIQVIGVTADIHERRLAEEALQESNQRLEEALLELRQAQERVIQNERLRALGQMASGIAHDLNNALTPIMGFADLLSLKVGKDLSQAELEQYLKLIGTAARDAAAIVRRMREFYRPRHSGETLVECDLASIAQEAIHLTEPLWQDTAQVQGRRIQASFGCPEPLPKVPMLISEVREALINLLLNAVDAMPTGGTLRVTLRRRRGQALLTVSDSGMGMSDETRRRCIEPFFTTKGTRGSGLGLAMVHGCMQRHNGKLEIVSQPGQGSSFTMVFPLPVAANREASPLDTPPASAQLPPVQGLRILLVDDEPQVRAVLAGMLEVDGHQLTLAASGEEALTLFDLVNHQVLITDRAMPGITGDQVARELKQRAPNLPVLMVTGFGGLMESSQEQPGGVDLVISKPVTLDKLRTALRRLLRGP